MLVGGLFCGVISLSFAMVAWSICSKDKKASLKLSVLQCEILSHSLFLLTLMDRCISLWCVLSHMVLCALTRVNLTDQQSDSKLLYYKFKTLFEFYTVLNDSM